MAKRNGKTIMFAYYNGKPVLVGSVNAPVTITFCLEEGAEAYAVVRTGVDGKLPYIPAPPEKDGFTFWRWSKLPNILAPINENTIFEEDTTLYPFYTDNTDTPDTPETPSTTQRGIDNAGYVYYNPDGHDGDHEIHFDEEAFYGDYAGRDADGNYVGRDGGRFYIELFARASDNGSFAGTAGGKYYFCDYENDAPVCMVDKESEDFDGDGIPDTWVQIRTEYCHSTDLAFDGFYGGSWVDFVSSAGSAEGKIVDCLDGDTPYRLVLYNIGGNDVVCLVNDNDVCLVVGGRSDDDSFVAVNYDETVYDGTAYEVLPIEQYEE